MSDEYDQEDDDKAQTTDISKQGSAKKKWNREMAMQYYSMTKQDIEERLNYEIP
jgi:hypothetical protein